MKFGLSSMFPAENKGIIVDLSKEYVEKYNKDIKEGMNISSLLFDDDMVLDIDNKSLTNRPDLWSHYGIAREFSVIYGKELKGEISEDKENILENIDKVQNDENIKDKIKVNVISKDLCKRAILIAIENVPNKESIKKYSGLLNNIGEVSKNLLVDMSNYIMQVTGQPLHFYDLDKIEGNNIYIEKIEGNNSKVTLLTLDDKEINVGNDTLIIKDEKKNISLAGIIGLKSCKVSDETSRILVEIANFDGLNIRRTMQDTALRTEASNRYEKQIDLNRIDSALRIVI